MPAPGRCDSELPTVAVKPHLHGLQHYVRTHFCMHVLVYFHIAAHLNATDACTKIGLHSVICVDRHRHDTWFILQCVSAWPKNFGPSHHDYRAHLNDRRRLRGICAPIGAYPSAVQHSSICLPHLFRFRPHRTNSHNGGLGACSSVGWVRLWGPPLNPHGLRFRRQRVFSGILRTPFSTCGDCNHPYDVSHRTVRVSDLSFAASWNHGDHQKPSDNVVQ